MIRKITKIKIRYYSKESLKYLLEAGAIYIAASSPYFALTLWKNIFKVKPQKRKAVNVFSYLKKRGLIEVKREGHDVRIALTEEGKKRAGKYQIDDLEIEKPKKWDKKWRLVIFDIPASSRLVRDVFRRKLKEFGFYPLQKSIWVIPYPCKEEVELLREFLGANKRQIQTLEVTKLEEERFLKKYFHF
jgi:DNA-binding transcriptional regulator PaaX